MRFALTTLALVASTSSAFTFAPRTRSSHETFTPATVKAFTPRTTTTFLKSTATEYKYEAEVGRVMDIIINSLYSDRDVFLRELVSNAADACDKRRFLSLTSEEGADCKISITPDRDNNQLIIEDSGVGLSKDEMVNNLGRIAQSGTKQFMEALADAKDSKDKLSLIGQFGVGFYSAFLVADKIEVISKRFDGNGVFKWESNVGEGGYQITELDATEKEEAGTKIILTMKEDASEYLEAGKLDTLLGRYSEFIDFPIQLWKEKTEYEQVPDDEANKDLAEGDEPKMKTVPIKKKGFENVNTQKPIWTRSPKDVTKEEYDQFYKTTFKANYDDPMAHNHFVIEGTVEAKSVIYIPGMLPFELSRDMFDESASSLRLYVKRVFINDKFEELIPRWLKFIRGVVDCNDLPLNVSREILQKSKALTVINKRLVRKSLDMIRDLAEDKDQYVMFWNNFGKYMKVGVVEDDVNREAVAPLLRFFTSRSGDNQYASLDEYIERIPEGSPKKIYYLTADSIEKVKMSPVIEKLTKQGLEVIFCTEPLDEICCQSLEKYKDHELVDASKSGALDDVKEKNKESDKVEDEAMKDKFESLVDVMETALSGKVKAVKIDSLLSESPAALVQGAYGMSPTMQRYMKMQSVSMGMDTSSIDGANQAILEINPSHPIINKLLDEVKASAEPDSDVQILNRVELIYDVAAMTSGYEVMDPAKFAKRVVKLMSGEAFEADDVIVEGGASDEDDSNDGDDTSVAKDVEVIA